VSVRYGLIKKIGEEDGEGEANRLEFTAIDSNVQKAMRTIVFIRR
jgi:hypothetical protein